MSKQMRINCINDLQAQIRSIQSSIVPSASATKRELPGDIRKNRIFKHERKMMSFPFATQ